MGFWYQHTHLPDERLDSPGVLQVVIAFVTVEALLVRWRSLRDLVDERLVRRRQRRVWVGIVFVFVDDGDVLVRRDGWWGCREEIDSLLRQETKFGFDQPDLITKLTRIDLSDRNGSFVWAADSWRSHGWASPAANFDPVG